MRRYQGLRISHEEMRRCFGGVEMKSPCKDDIYWQRAKSSEFSRQSSPRRRSIVIKLPFGEHLLVLSICS